MVGDRQAHLDLPAPVAAQLLAAEALSEVNRAAIALGTAGAAVADAALHDFRVALRRLRTLLRGYASLVPWATPTWQQALAELASTTGAARDWEVLADWLDRRAAKMRTNRAPDQDAILLAQVRAECQKRRAEARRVALPRWRVLERQGVRRGASRAAEPKAAGNDLKPFAHVLSAAIEAAVANVSRRARRARARPRRRRLHRLRIALKRLRYLTEPLGVPPAVALLVQLRELQTVIGDWHDRDLIVEELRRLSDGLDGGEMAPAQREVLRAWRRRARAERRKLAARIERRLNGDSFERLCQDGRQLAADLAAEQPSGRPGPAAAVSASL